MQLVELPQPIVIKWWMCFLLIQQVATSFDICCSTNAKGCLTVYHSHLYWASVGAVQPNNGICYSGMVRKICNFAGRTRRSQETFFVYKFYFYRQLSWYFGIRDLVHYFTENSSQKFKAYPYFVSSVHKDMMKWRAEDEGRMKAWKEEYLRWKVASSYASHKSDKNIASHEIKI